MYIKFINAPIKNIRENTNHVKPTPPTNATFEFLGLFPRDGRHCWTKWQYFDKACVHLYNPPNQHARGRRGCRERGNTLEISTNGNSENFIGLRITPIQEMISPYIPIPKAYNILKNNAL